MKQSRAMSLVESVANVIVGYGVAVVTQILIFPVFGLRAAHNAGAKLPFSQNSALPMSQSQELHRNMDRWPLLDLTSMTFLSSSVNVTRPLASGSERAMQLPER